MDTEGFIVYTYEATATGAPECHAYGKTGSEAFSTRDEANAVAQEVGGEGITVMVLPLQSFGA